MRQAPAAALTPLAGISAPQWRALSMRAAEPNGYYLPEWELAVNASARGRVDTAALGAWRDASSLIGLVPVISMWRAYKIPLPALVSADPYGTLCTPLLDRDMAEEAVTGILQQARQAGAHALIFRATSLDGAAMKAFADVLRRGGMQPVVLQSHVRACLDATGDADEMLREALGAKKLKELRRQRNRLAEHGAVHFDVARTPAEMTTAVETFLMLEASGWKGQARHRAQPGRRRCGLRPPRHVGAGGDRPVRDRDPAGRRNAGGRRHRAAPSGPRLLLQARRRRTLCEVFAGRAADAGIDPASLRRSGHSPGRFHRRPPTIP